MSTHCGGIYEAQVVQSVKFYMMILVSLSVVNQSLCGGSSECSFACQRGFLPCGTTCVEYKELEAEIAKRT